MMEKKDKRRISKEVIVGLLKKEFQTEFVNVISLNRYDIGTARGGRVFVSQCQPSRTSKGHWKYEFFHTITEEVIEEVMNGSGVILLVNYVDEIYAVLNASDIVWAVRHSSRIKGYKEKVTDIVVDKIPDGTFQLRPYDRFSRVRRHIRVIEI